MSEPLFIELGMGADLQDRDPTRACVKAVKDAISTNYMPAIRRMTGGDVSRMRVHVRVAVPHVAGAPDPEMIAKALPHGKVTVEVVDGGLLTTGGGVRDGENDQILVAVAAVEVSIAD